MIEKELVRENQRKETQNSRKIMIFLTKRVAKYILKIVSIVKIGT